MNWLIGKCIRRKLVVIRVTLLLALFVCAIFALNSNVSWAKPVSNGGSKAASERAKVKREKAKKYYSNAQKFIKSNKNDRAMNELFDCTSADPSWPDGWKLLAEVCLKMNNFSNAYRAYGEYLKLKPNDTQVKYAYGRALLAASEYDKAEVVWDEILEKDANSYEAIYSKGAIAMSRGQFVEALGYADDALLVKPDYPEALALRIRVNSRAHRYSKADKDLKYLRKILPKDDPLLLDLEGKEGESIAAGIRRIWLSAGVAIVTFVSIVLMVIYIKKSAGKVRIKPAPFDMDANSESSICGYTFLNIMNHLLLPRGLCWVKTIDGRHLELMLSELIENPNLFANRNIDEKFAAPFIEKYGQKPFLYSEAKKDKLFEDLFPGLIEDLKGIDIDVCVPLVHEEKDKNDGEEGEVKKELVGLILLGKSSATELAEVKKTLNEKMHKVSYYVSEGSGALYRLNRSKRRVYDTKTSLWNRDYFETNIVDMSKGCAILGRTLCAYMVTAKQLKNLIEYKGDDYVKDFLYEMGATLRSSLSHEEGIILCHLDNGVFGVIAPERTAQEGVVLAKTLQSAASQVKLPESQELSNGIVAWTLFPDDSDDPKMLRAILSRAFRDLRMGSVDTIARALNVTDATKVSAVKVVDTPEEEVVIKRRAKASSAAPGIGSGGVAATKGTVTALPKNEEAPIVRKYVPAPEEAPAPKRNSPLSGFSKINIAAKDEASGETRIASPAKKLEVPMRGGDFKVVPDLDEDGIDQYTQFCGEEGFMSIIDSEMGMDSSLVFVHFANLKALRSKGQDSYMKLRKDMAGFIQAYMFDEDDAPGLIGEDDFAVLMTGKDISKAQGFANKVYNMASNMEGVKLALVIISCKDYDNSASMLGAVKSKIAEAGVHVIQSKG